MTDVITDDRDVEAPGLGVVELDELDQQLVVPPLIGKIPKVSRAGRRHPAEPGLVVLVWFWG